MLLIDAFEWSERLHVRYSPLHSYYTLFTAGRQCYTQCYALHYTFSVTQNVTHGVRWLCGWCMGDGHWAPLSIVWSLDGWCTTHECVSSRLRLTGKTSSYIKRVMQASVYAHVMGSANFVQCRLNAAICTMQALQAVPASSTAKEKRTRTEFGSIT